MGALYFCTFFLGVVMTLSVQPVFSAERTVFYRERAAHMYSVLPYALSLVRSLHRCHHGPPSALPCHSVKSARHLHVLLPALCPFAGVTLQAWPLLSPCSACPITPHVQSLMPLSCLLATCFF